ncbi:MAG: hypothetical protein JOZ43_06150, partial [Acidobacteriales bacterium]|nr:hypothetical protein [Terriglobales bacterium]
MARWLLVTAVGIWKVLEWIGAFVLWIPHVIWVALLWLFRKIVALPALSLGRVFRFGLLGFIGLWVVVVLIGLALALYPNTQLVPLREVEQYVYLNQGWGDGLEAHDRQLYYYKPQGTDLKNLRYDWLINLEMPFQHRLLAEPANMRRFGFYVDAFPSSNNPDQLPVGFTKHYDYDLKENVLDITCAACHTGQLDVASPSTGKLYTVRIDGGQAMHAFTAVEIGHFIPTLLESLTTTYLDPFKFNRFAHRVLKEHYNEGKRQLHAQLWQTIKLFAAQAWNDKRLHLYPTVEGFGRTDALARIGNTVFAENLDAANYRVGDAPVSYPPVWNAWKMDWVQYNASVRQPLARNLGESLGVGAKMDLVAAHGFPIPPQQRYWTSAIFSSLRDIEEALWDLQPPLWPEGCLG